LPFESPILSLRESYRPVRTPTVVMPLLIGALMTGLAAFYLKTRPLPEPAAPSAPMLVATPIETEVVEEIPAEPLPKEAPAESAPALAAPMSLSEADFTPWLSPLALETYIRAKNGGSRLDFWEQGHWIRAVEARWREGAPELRIAVAKIAPGQSFRWQYRFDMSEIEFTEAFRRLEGEGFRMVHSHVYLRPGGEKRHQAVWRTGLDGGGEELLRR